MGNNGNLGGGGNNAISSSPNSGNNSGYGANGGYGGGGGADVAAAAAAAAAAGGFESQGPQTTPGTGYSDDARGMMDDLVGALTSPLGGQNATQDVADAYATGQPTDWGQTLASGLKDFSGYGNGGFWGSSLGQGLGYGATLGAGLFGGPLAAIPVGALTSYLNGGDPTNIGINAAAGLAGVASPIAGMIARAGAGALSSYAMNSAAPGAAAIGGLAGGLTGMPFGGMVGGFIGNQIGRGLDQGLSPATGPAPSQQQGTGDQSGVQLAGLSSPAVTGPVSAPLRGLMPAPSRPSPLMFGQQITPAGIFA